MYSKEPVQQVLGFLAWKMYARVTYHCNNSTNIKILQSVFTSLNPVNIITVLIRQMEQVINKNIFYAYFKCNILVNVLNCYSVKRSHHSFAGYNYLATRTAREVENSMIFYFCGETTEIAMKRVNKYISVLCRYEM